MPASTLIQTAAKPALPRIPAPPAPAEPKTPWIGFLILFAIIAASAAYWYASRSTAKPPAPAIRTAIASRGTLVSSLRISGMTLARNRASLVTPRLSGRRSRNSSQGDFRLTLRFLVPAGSKVKAGEVVAEFDRQYMTLRLDDLAADARARELTLETLRANLAANRKAYDQRILAAEGAVDKAKLDLRTIPVRSAIVAAKYRLNLEEAEAHLKQLRLESHYFDISETAAMRSQELELQEVQLDLRRSRRNDERMRVRAPIDGIFVPQRVRRGGEYKDIQAGDDLAPGTVIGDIHDTAGLTVEAAVNQADIHLIRAGLPATLHADAFPDLSIPAKVTRIGSMAQPGGMRPDYVRNVPVRLRVLGSDPRLMPNYTIAADIALSSTAETILIPRQAVFPAGGNHVFVRAKDGWVKRPVTVAAANHLQVAVTSGVTQGEVVALEAPKSL